LNNRKLGLLYAKLPFKISLMVLKRFYKSKLIKSKAAWSYTGLIVNKHTKKYYILRIIIKNNLTILAELSKSLPNIKLV